MMMMNPLSISPAHTKYCGVASQRALLQPDCSTGADLGFDAGFFWSDHLDWRSHPLFDPAIYFPEPEREHPDDFTTEDQDDWNFDELDAMGRGKDHDDYAPDEPDDDEDEGA